MKFLYQLFFGLLSLCTLSIGYAQTYIIPHVADGGGWKTTLVLTNTTTGTATAALSCRKETTGGATTAWNLSFQETTSISNLSLAGAGTLFLHTAGTDATTAVGWCEMDADSGIEAYAIFTRTDMSPSQEGTALASEATNHIILPFDNAGGLTTSMAIVNPGSVAQTVAASMRTVDGTNTITSLGSVPAYGHMSFEVPAKFTSTVGKRGLIEFHSSTGTLAAIALRFNSGGAFTSAPVFADSGSLIVGSTAPSTLGVKTITMTSSTVTAGDTVTGTVRLTSAAPASGATVWLASNNSTAVTLPDSVFVEAGASTATFMVTANQVSVSQNVTITASMGTTTATAALTVQPAAQTSTSWFTKLVLTLTVQPAGYSSSSAAMAIVPDSNNSTYTAQLIGPALMLDLVNGTATSDGLSFTFNTLASVGHRALVLSGLSMAVSSATVTLTVSAPPTDIQVAKTGTATGTFVVTGVPSGSSLPVMVTGTISGTYSAN